MAPVAAVIAGIAAVPGLIVSAASTSGFDPLQFIGTTISPVLVIVLLLMGKLHTDVDYRRLDRYATSEHEERLRLQNVMTESVLPNLHRATLIMEALLPLVEAEVRLRQARDRERDQSGGI